MNTNKNFSGRLRMSKAVAAKLRAHHLANGKHIESCSFALGHAYVTSKGERCIVLSDPTAVLLFGNDCFVSKSFGHVSLHKDVKAQVFLRAVREGYTAVVDIHDHHFTSDAWFSGTDDADDLANALYVTKTVQKFMPEGKELMAAALLLTQGTWAARYVMPSDGCSARFASMRVDCVGTQFDCMSQIEASEPDARDARHQGLVSARQREFIRCAHVAVVGVGGTGSIAVEGLLRSGFRHITIIDADLVESSNLNRLQGAGPDDVGRRKADVIADRAAHIAPDALVSCIPTMVFDDAAISALRSADLILGCVDNRETRWWLNRFCVQYMVPWFDCGVVVHSDSPVHHEVRVGGVISGTLCCGHCGPVEFFPRKMPSLFLDQTSLAVQRAAGYVKESAQESAPSAYLVNLQAVGCVLEEVMNWFCAWREPAVSVYWRSNGALIERIDASITNLEPNPECAVCGTLLGKCDEEPLSGIARQIDLSVAAASLRTDDVDAAVTAECQETTSI